LAAVAILLALAPPLLSITTQQQQPGWVVRTEASPLWAAASREPLPLLPGWASMPHMPLQGELRGSNIVECSGENDGWVDDREGLDEDIVGEREAEAMKEEDRGQGGGSGEEGRGDGQASPGDFCEVCKTKDWKEGEIPKEMVQGVMRHLQELAKVGCRLVGREERGGKGREVNGRGGKPSRSNVLWRLTLAKSWDLALRILR